MVSRSNSFIGTIKSILPANLPWFGAGSDQPDTPSKRKQVEERQDVEEGTRSSKRQRKASPLGELGEMGQAASRGQPQASLPQTAYLDPPQRAFSQSAVGKALRPPPMHARASSVAVPSRSTRTPGISLGLGVARGRSIGFGRTKSMDPPDRLRSVSYRPALSPMPISRDVSMEDLSFEDTPSSPSQPFRMRTSLTPQIPDLDIGLMGRKEREVSEPPPVSDLVDKPAFIRAPPDAPRQATPLTRSESLTLGAVAEAHKQAKPLQRSHSSLVIGSGEGATQDGQSTSQPAEKALRELDVYKTPLLPTRLRGSSTVPEMFRAKRGKAPVLMHDRHDKPRLGTGDNNGVLAKVEESPSTKPYAGRGGTKKLLEKRRLEEEQEQERAKAAFMDDEIEEGTRKTANELDSQLIAELRPIATAKEPESPTPVTTIGGREQPSLRVGRARVSRNHITRPMMHGRPGRFSAIEEEEEDDLMGEGAQKKAPRYTNAPPMLPSFQPPAGFSFAKDTAGPKVDDPNAKEAPIASLPFSLAMSSTASSSAGPSSKVEKPSSISLPSGSSKPTAATTPPATVAASSNTVPASASPTPLFPSVPQVAVTPATPKAGESGSETSKTSPSVPNFFAGSSFLSKPLGSPGSPTPSFNLTGSSEGVKAASSFFAPLNDKKAEQPSIFAKPAASTDDIFSPHNKENSATSAPGAASTEPSQPPFGAPATTAPVSAFPAFGVPASTSVSQPPKEKETVIAPKPKPATAAAAPSPFAFGTPSKPAEKPPAAPSLPFAFGTPTKSTETAVASPTPSPAPFAFGTPTKLVEPAAGSPSPSPAPFAFSTPTKSNAPAAPSTPFAFGAPTQAEAPKSDAGSRPQTAEAPKSLFGTAPAAPQSPSPFTFGTPTKTEAPKSDAGSRPVTAEAPKSLFNLVPVAPQPVTPLRGFSPAAPSTPEPVKAPFIFGQPVTPGPASAPSTPAPPEAPKSMFGAAGAGGFTFGQPSTNSAASTPTKPPFAFGAAPATPTNENKPFTFGTPTTQAAPAAFSTPTAAADTSKPFTFGAPSTPAREATPPKREDSEVMMDESPARPPTELGKPELPKINASGFSFNIAGAASSPFSSPQTTNGFSFTQPPASSALFGTKPEAKPAEKSGGTFTFGQSTTGNTGFAFGSQKPVETNTAAPAPTFTFNTPTPTPTAPSAPFGFGAPQISQSTSFGSNAPASPFGQPTGNGFAFGSGTTPTSTTSPFTFSGSQPASPATTNVGLPAQNGGGGFTFGASSSVAPAAASSPFAAPAPLPEAGGALFTMGAAPPAGSRQMKALPKRRPGKR